MIQITLRKFLLLSFCILHLGLKSAPNVLFIYVDDMNDWVGCLGSDRVPTLHIDALAERGLLFPNAHAPSPKCAPSRAAILAGQRASTTGLYSNGHWWRPAYPDIITLPQYFKIMAIPPLTEGKSIITPMALIHPISGTNISIWFRIRN